jgi:diguanylate cyclase (GGDEF)-like protein
LSTSFADRVRSEADERPLRLFSIVALAIGVAAGLASLVLSLSGEGGVDERQVRMAGAGTVCLAAVAATVAVVRSRAPSLVRPSTHTVALMLGLTCWAIAAGLWFVRLATDDDAVSAARGGMADHVYLLSGILLIVFVFTHPALGTAQRRLRAAIDATIVAVSLSVLTWLLAGRELLALTDAPLSTASAYLLPATDVVVLFMLLGALSLTSELPVRSNVATLAAAGMASALLGDTLGLIDRAHGSPPAVVVLSTVLLVTSLVLIAGAAVVSRRHEFSAVPVASRHHLRGLLAAAPVLTAIIATAAVLVDAALSGRFDATAALVLTVVICAVLARQSLTLSDNRELADSLQRTIDELELQATHDVLTGLPNRAGLVARIDDAVAAADGRQRRAALLFLDVDHLKTVNDTLGHRAGDALICSVAERIAERVGARVTRFGGDEFVVLLDDLQGAEQAERTGRQLVDDIGQPVTVEGHQLRLTASVGVAEAEPDVDAEELLRRADVALYRAKALGRACVVTYRHTDDDDSRFRPDLEPELRRAVARDEFVLHYQPIVELGSGQVAGVEALLRWRHPDRGLLSPDAFLEEATSSGLLGAIGERSLQRACADFAAIAQRSGRNLPRSVAVNLSSSELTDRQVVRRVADALAASGLEPSHLTLEITEDVIVDDTIRSTIDRLVQLGASISIDDFGTGNSSLRQLGSYPAQKLKIDKSFVDRVEHDASAVALVRALVRLAGHLGLTTVAEGVESEHQAELLAQLGCDRAQGWRYARAMPLDDLLEWCEAYRPVARDTGVESRSSTSSASPMMRSSSSATVGRSSIAPTT